MLLGCFWFVFVLSVCVWSGRVVIPKPKFNDNRPTPSSTTNNQPPTDHPPDAARGGRAADGGGGGGLGPGADAQPHPHGAWGMGGIGWDGACLVLVSWFMNRLTGDRSALNPNPNSQPVHRIQNNKNKQTDEVKMMSTDITLDPNSPHVKFSDLGITPTPVEKVCIVGFLLR